MKWIIELCFIGGIVWFVLGQQPPPISCDCPELPENYFVVETKETETCIDSNRETIVTKVVRSANVESN
jgi:hypothetical protein